MRGLNRNYNVIIEALLIFVILLSSTTGWYIIDFIGMAFFWLVFITSTLVILFYIFFKRNLKKNIFNIFNKKFNITVGLYLIWLTITYFVNYTGRFSVLYIFKVWLLVGIYLVVSQLYFDSLSKDEKYRFVYRCAKYIFSLSIFLILVALYQFIFDSNTIFGLTVSDWPTYNSASMYGNVNGFGTYLFFSIVSGLYLLSGHTKDKIKYLISFIIVVQIYILYLTVARTSIVITIFYIIVTFFLFSFHKREAIKNIFNMKNIITLIVANLIMLSIFNIPDIKYYIFNIEQKSKERKASDMMAEKNSKGVNNRQFIWRAVLNNYDEYALFGDGLKYTVVSKINVEEVISKRSKGVSRISYHNTLFRYFASNGLLGLILFLILFLSIPLRLLKKMNKTECSALNYWILITFFICIFLYMQMEEVYLGEVGFVPIVTCLVMSLSNSLLE